MKVTVYKGILSALVVVGVLLSGVPIIAGYPGSTVEAQVGASAEPLPDRLLNDIRRLQEKADEHGNVVVVVKLEGTSLLGIQHERVVEELKQHAARTQESILQFLERRDTEVLNTFWLTNAVLARVPVGLLDELARQPGVERFFENFTLTIPQPPDEGRLQQGLSEEYTWGLEMIRVPEVWSTLGSTGSGVRVAVSDTGVDISHPDLAGKMWTDDPGDPTYPGGWIEFDGEGNIVLGSTPYDTASHGTHCSGTVLGGADSGIAIGVAPDAILMHALILPGGGGSFAQVIRGMEWSIEPFDQYGHPAGERADVHSMSWGAGGYHDAMIVPIENMRAAGVVPVPAIGNSGEGSSGSPGNVYQAFGIGATDVDDNVADFPHWGSSGELIDWPASHPEPYIKPDFSAPGVDVWSSVPGGYGYMSGTSMAAPHAAGTLALMLAANPTLTVDEIYEILKDTAIWYDRYYPEAPCTRYGWGRIDAFEAVAVAALESGIEGIVTDADTGDPLVGAKVVVAETGQTRHTDALGHYRFYLLPGSYDLTASAFGYYEETAEVVEVVEDAFTAQDFALSARPSGFIAGTVTDVETGLPIEGATITVLDTPLSASTAAAGNYSVQAPVGTYDVMALAWGYKSSMIHDVHVLEDETVTANFELEPALVVAVLGDHQSQLTGLLMDNDISSHERDWDIIEDTGNYHAVVVNRPYDPGEETFLEFLQAASDNEVGVVFTSSWPVEWEPYGISLLQRYLGDPAGQGDHVPVADVYYHVTQPHPIFEDWHVGDSITIIDSGDRDYAWFWGYSGYTVADIGSEDAGIQGNAVALNVYGKSLHVLLAGLAPQWFANVSHWTDDAETIFINAITFAALDSGIEGYVTDEETEAPLEGAKVWVNETGQAAYTDETGFYRLYLPPGTYNVTAQAFGYYDSSAEGVEVVEDVLTPQDFDLAPMPSGFIAGTVTDVETGLPIEGAIITLLDTPAATATDEDGCYSIEAPEGTYDVEAWAWGYKESIAHDVVVEENETVIADLNLEPMLVAAVLGDYQSQLTTLLLDKDILAEERGWDIMEDIGEYDVVVVNLIYAGETTFLEFLQAASDSEVGVVFTSSFPAEWEPYGISLLQWYLGDPAGQSFDMWMGDVYYNVTQEHPIFEGWEVGDEIPIIADDMYGMHAWFWDYSGYTIGEVGSEHAGIRGDAVAVNAYGKSLHVLLASLAPQWDTNVPHWTEDARTIFINAVSFAALDSGIEGVVTDGEAGEPLAGAEVVIEETGQVTHTDDSGYYRFFLPPGDYTVTAGMFGYYEATATVEVVGHEFTTEDFALEPLPTGFIAGQVTGLKTGFPVPEVMVNVAGTPLSTTTDEAGYYSITAPVDTYTVEAAAWRHKTARVPDVEVSEDETTIVDFQLGRTLGVGLLGDYEGQLVELLADNDLTAREADWDIIDNMAAYDAVVVNLPSYPPYPGRDTFVEFLDAASANRVGIVFTSSRWSFDRSYGISLLQRYLGDPTAQDHDSYRGHVYYQVTQSHPIFEGWQVGDEIDIITAGAEDHAWFQWYSGDTIANVGTEWPGLRGEAVAVKEYGSGRHVLLASLAPQSITHVDHWTEDARAIFINAVNWVGEIIIAEAEIGLTKGLGEDGVALAGARVENVYDPGTGQPMEVPGGISAYRAKVSYDPAQINILDVRGGEPPFDGQPIFNIDNEAGEATFAAFQTAAEPQPAITVADLAVRLVGSALDQAKVELSFIEIVDGDGNLILAKETDCQVFQRGDAKVDREITMADPLFIAQYLVDIREIGEGLEFTHPINAASVRHDDAGDEITMADALFIAQYLVGLRDHRFEPIGPLADHVVQYEEETHIAFAPTPLEVASGQPFTVQLNISNAPETGMATHLFHISFAPGVIEFGTDVNDHDWPDPDYGVPRVFVVDNEEGSIRFGDYYAQIPAPGGDLTIAVLHGTAVATEPTVSELRFDVADIEDPDGNRISVDVCDGEVVVDGATVLEIVGTVWEVDCARPPLEGGNVTLYDEHEVEIDSTVSDGDGNYTLAVPDIGDYQVVASKAGFREETQAITVTEATIYTLDFIGDHGLIPNDPDVFYVLDCIYLWKHGEPPCDMDVFSVLDVIYAWKNPILED